MCKFDSPPTLRQLLDYCSDPSDPCYQWGWAEFYDRFNNYIYCHVRQNCFNWNAKRLSLQLADAVEDIVLEVYGILVKNECKNLKSFIFRDDKIRLLAWLKKVCWTASSRYLKKHFPSFLEEENFDSMISHIGGLDSDCTWEYYELVVKISRMATQRKFLERDLIIFQLVVFGQLSKLMIKSHHCFAEMTDHNIEVAIHRIREILRKNKNLF